jgi:hypothetical protein
MSSLGSRFRCEMQMQAPAIERLINNRRAAIWESIISGDATGSIFRYNRSRAAASRRKTMAAQGRRARAGASQIRRSLPSKAAVGAFATRLATRNSGAASPQRIERSAVNAPRRIVGLHVWGVFYGRARQQINTGKLNAAALTMGEFTVSLLHPPLANPE